MIAVKKYIRGISTRIQKALDQKLPEIDIFDLNSEVKRSGLVQTIHGIHVALFMGEDMFKDISRTLLRTILRINFRVRSQ
jgi:hypothetical protein